MPIRAVWRRARAAWLLAAACVALAAFAPVATRAHEGHDHGDEARAPLEVAPRAAASGDAFDVVAVVEGARLRLYVDRADTNEPVNAAAVEVEAGGRTVAAAATPEGSFVVALEALGIAPGKGRHALTVVVAAGADSDLLPLDLDLAPAGKVAAADLPAGGRSIAAASATATAGTGDDAGTDARTSASAASWIDRAGGPAVVAALAAAVVLVIAATLFGRRRRAASSWLLPFLAALAFAAPSDAPAQSPPPAEPLQRLSDGSLFVPKSAQRLLGLRTVAVAAQPVAQSVTLQGRVVPDPNFLGHAQPSQSGRIEPGPRGLPLVGQSVRKGDVLALVRPAVSAIDRANQRGQLADLQLQLDLAERKARRLEQLEGSVPQREIDQARAEVASLRERVPQLARALDATEPLVSPVSGVVTVSNAAPGQLVGPTDVVFEVAAPGRLLVEALSYDTPLASISGNATLVGFDGALALVGGSPQLREGARTLHFAPVRPMPELLINQLVQVVVMLKGNDRAVVVPRDAVVAAPGGATTVIVKRAPERFEVVPVAVRPLGGQRVALRPSGTAEIADGDRVVVVGAPALSQIR